MGRKQAPTTDLSPDSLPADHLLVQLGVPKGSNNFLCTDTDGIERLVELGSKIRKTVLATRGDFAIMKLFPPDPASKKSEKSESTGSLAGEVVFVASTKDVRDWKKAGEWPAGFGDAPAPPPAPVSDQPSEDEEEEHDRSEDGVEDHDAPAQ